MNKLFSHIVLSVILIITFSGCLEQSDTIQENAPITTEIEHGTFSPTPIPTKSITDNPISTPPKTPLVSPTINPKKITYGFDLIYKVPNGWTEDKSNTDMITLSVEEQNEPGTDFYGVSRSALMVFPSQPLGSSLADTYSVLWRDIVLGIFTTDIKPLPMQLRLNSGYVLAYDGGNMKIEDGPSTMVVFYMIAAEDKVVPIVAIFGGGGNEITIRNFLETATILGSSPSKAPLFTEDQMVGQWTTSDVSLASYVDSSGNYAGDASMAYGTTYQFRDDGTFSDNFAVVKTSGAPLKTSESGIWSVDDSFLVLEDKETGKISRLRIWGIGQSPRAGHFMLRLDNWAGQKMELVVPRRPMSGEWYESK